MLPLVFRALSIAVLLLATGCITIEVPTDTGSGTGLMPTGSSTGVTTDPPIMRPTEDAGGGTGVNPTDAGGGGGESDVSVPPSCGTHCDCPPGYDCINERCVLGELAIQCCTHPECPAGERCWSEAGLEGVCGDP